MMERMREGGYQRVDRDCAKQEGEAGFRGSGWQSLSGAGVVCGRECDAASESEILAAVGEFGLIHQLMQLPDVSLS
ncbi:MAG: hypothetical protein ACLTSZ_10140 [Lachnospiraceae bacterium]